MLSLQGIHQGALLDEQFFDLLDSMYLFEPLNIEISLSTISSINLLNYYTINKEKLASLDAESLAKLNKAGVLGLVFFALSSLGNFNKLIELKNNHTAIAQ